MFRYWGKTSKKDASYHLLPYHCLDVGAAFHCILDAAPFLRRKIHALTPGLPPQHINALLLYFAILHDLGKFAPVFQRLCPDLATRLGTPTARLQISLHHSHLGQAIFLNKKIHLVWQESLCSPSFAATRRALSPLVNAAFGHHGRPPAAAKIDPRLSTGTIEAITSFLREVASLVLPGQIHLPGDDDNGEETFKAASWLIAGVMVLADWLGSGTAFPFVAQAMPLETYWRDHALPRAREAVSACGILPPPPRRSGGFHDLLPHLDKRHGPTPLQDYALKCPVHEEGPHLFIFEDVTGAGKTEAAVLTAHALMVRGEAEGFYIGLPTMATANGMYARLAKSYRALFEISEAAVPSLMLAHGARAIHDQFLSSIGLEATVSSQGDAEDGEDRDAGPFCASWLADNRKKALLAPCGVGTLDQALLSVLPARHQCLRLLGLGRSVLIADEVHGYDPYTTRLLEGLLTFHAGLGGSAILLSATLPLGIKRRLADAFCRGAGWMTPQLGDAALPLATHLCAAGCDETGLPPTRRLSVRVTLSDNPAAAFDRLDAVHAAGGCAIMICNTVDRTIAARNSLAERLPGQDLLLFHARFALCDRLAIEERVLAVFGKDSQPEDRRGKILVASQVAEQSLDLDGDYLVTELAPMELLIQRAGRCQRHVRERPQGFGAAAMLVIAPRATDAPGPDWGEAELGKGRFVYPAHGLLWRTARLLEERGGIELPKEARGLVEGAYDDERWPTPPGLQAAEAKSQGTDVAERSLARSGVLGFAQGYGPESAGNDGWYDDRVVPTRLGAETVRLRLVRVTPAGFELWAGPGLDAGTCARSEVSVRLGRAKGLVPEGDWKERLEAFATAMPDKGRRVTLVPFAPSDAPDVWQCALPGTTATYSREAGLRYGEEK